MVYLSLPYWVSLYTIEYVWYSIKWLWTHESPGNYFVGLFFVIAGIIAYHKASSAIDKVFKP